MRLILALTLGVLSAAPAQVSASTQLEYPEYCRLMDITDVPPGDRDHPCWSYFYGR